MSGNLTYTAVLDTSDGDEQQKPRRGPHFINWDSLHSSQPEPETEEPGQEIEVVHVRDGHDEVSRLEEQYEQLKTEKAAAEQTASAERQRREAYDVAIQAARHRDELAAEYWREEANLRGAQDRYEQSSQNYSHGEAASAVAEIGVRTQRLRELSDAYSTLEGQATIPAAQPQRQLTADEQFEDAIAHYSGSDKNWIRRNRDDLMANPERVKLAETSAQFAERRHGIQPGSDEFYAFLDEAMGYDGDAAEARQPAKKAKQQSRRMYAAPSSRATSRSPGGSVHLSEFDQEQARALGISFRDYAVIKSKANKGQYDKSITGGRLHASYSVNSFDDHY
jgi:hypothetical protein